MFWWVICTCEEQYYKINLKYEKCKHAKTKAFCKNISCSFICFIFLFFSYGTMWNFDWMFFIKLIFDQTKMFEIVLYTLSNLFDQINFTMY